MSISIRIFASLSESIGRREAECDHEVGMTVGGLWKTVTNGEVMPEGLMCAVNHNYCELAHELSDDDEVAYFPPVTGG